MSRPLPMTCSQLHEMPDDDYELRSRMLVLHWLTHVEPDACTLALLSECWGKSLRKHWPGHLTSESTRYRRRRAAGAVRQPKDEAELTPSGLRMRRKRERDRAKARHNQSIQREA